jgi:hypothetical protein
MTIRTAIKAMLQRFTGQQTTIPDAMPGPYIGDDPWLMDLYVRLQRELDALYATTEPDEMESRQRIARILRAFHLMEPANTACARIAAWPCRATGLKPTPPAIPVKTATSGP